MKRLKYTRRFVNVQLTGGKRKVRVEHGRKTGDAASVVPVSTKTLMGLVFH